MDMRARSNVIGSILVGFTILVGTPAWAADSKAAPTPTVSLTQAVHFTDAKGQDVTVVPGEYAVEVAGKSGLKLTPTDGKEPIVIEGQAGSLIIPAALSVPVNENEHHLLLVLPKGKVVETVGSPSGVRGRSDGLKQLSLVFHLSAADAPGNLKPPPPPPGLGRAHMGLHDKPEGRERIWVVPEFTLVPTPRHSL